MPPAPKTCSECGRSFTKAAHLIRHVRSHQFSKPFACSTCGKTFARTDALQRHERTLHPTQQNNGLRSSDLTDVSMGDISPGASTTLNVDNVHDHEQPSFLHPDLYDIPSILPQSEQQTGVTMPVPTEPPPPPLLEGMDIVNLLEDWLNHGEGHPSAENALTLLFADSSQSGGSSSLPYNQFISADPTGIDWPSSLDFTSFQPPEQRYAQPTAHDRTSTAGNTLPRLPINSASQFSVPATPSQSVGTGAHLSKHTVPPRAGLSADTWESGISQSRGPGTPRPERSYPSRITSPEQVVVELQVDVEAETPNSSQRDSVIPSMTFLDSCLHLYFRDFHPCFPIIHRPSFRRDRTPPLLLLSMCSIGCMFVGTRSARETGVWIYHRLHYIIVFTRDTKMANEATRVAVTLSALLGQCFSFLYGQPKQMLTAEAFHGTLCTMARRSGLLKAAAQDNPISSQDVASLDDQGLQQAWREWSRYEMLRRASYGLTIHATEVTIYSGLPNLVPTRLPDGATGFGDALFEAEDAFAWRNLLALSAANILSPSTSSERCSDVFLPTVLLAQRIVNVHTLRLIDKAASTPETPGLTDFYDDMLELAEHQEILADSDPKRPRRLELRALWHYTCVVRLAPLDLIEEAAGRGGTKGPISELQAWIDSPSARLAVLHCGHILHRAADLSDLAFLLPRAIFHAALLLFCYFTYAKSPSEITEPVDVVQVCDWRSLAALCEQAGGTAQSVEGARLAAEALGTPYERFLTHGMSVIQIKGFTTGRETQMNLVSLRSTAHRILRRCTPWGIGDTLAEILSNVSF